MILVTTTSDEALLAGLGRDPEALEEDPEAESAVKGRDDLQGIPPQLYFVHQGQQDIKELHWHAQLPGVLGSTAGDSFHLLKPANAGDGPAGAEM